MTVRPTMVSVELRGAQSVRGVIELFDGAEGWVSLSLCGATHEAGGVEELVDVLRLSGPVATMCSFSGAVIDVLAELLDRAQASEPGDRLEVTVRRDDGAGKA